MERLNQTEIAMLTDQYHRNLRLDRNRRIGIVTKAEIEKIWDAEEKAGRYLSEDEVRALLDRPESRV